jgi:ATP-dependent exoDNAse (exonuclease V) beta subunit
MCNEKPIKYYKEYELRINDTTGSIDLLVETANSFIVIDYKSKDIDKDYYNKQVRTYVDAISKKTTKRVLGFLYSIEDSKYRSVI